MPMVTVRIADHSALASGCFCWAAFNQPKAEAPPTGFDLLGLPVRVGSGDFAPPENLRSRGSWFSLDVVGLGHLPTSLKRPGVESKPLLGWVVELDRVVLSLAGFRTFIPRPRPALWYPELEFADDARTSGRGPWVESRLHEPQMLPLSDLVGVSGVLPFARLSVSLTSVSSLAAVDPSLMFDASTTFRPCPMTDGLVVEEIGDLTGVCSFPVLDGGAGVTAGVTTACSDVEAAGFSSVRDLAMG